MTAAEAYATVLAGLLELAAEARRSTGLSRRVQACSGARRWWSRPRGR